VPDPSGSSHKVLEVNEDEAKVLRKAISLVLDEGLAVYTATQHLNALGLFTRKGKRWDYRNLTWQLKRDDLAGTRTYKAADGPISSSIHPIVDQTTWDQLQTSIRGKPTGKPTKKQLYPLTGHLDCPCGGHLSGHPRYGRSYKCSRNKPEWGDRRCDQYPRHHRAEQLEAAVWADIYKVVTDAEYLRHLLEVHLSEESVSSAASHDQSRSLKGRIRQKRKQQVTITQEYAAAGIDARVLREAIQGIATDINVLETQLNQAEQWNEVRRMKADAVVALNVLARKAKEQLASPTLELMKQVADLLDIRVLVHPDGLQLTGTLPMDAWAGVRTFSGELRAGVPRGRGPRPPRCGPVVVATLRGRDPEG
jgi:hypothetical protein